MFNKKKKVHKGSDKVVLHLISELKASDRSYNCFYPEEYYECYYKLYSRRYKKYQQEDFQRDLKMLGF